MPNRLLFVLFAATLMIGSTVHLHQHQGHLLAVDHANLEVKLALYIPNAAVEFVIEFLTTASENEKIKGARNGIPIFQPTMELDTLC
ncbi:unnamed protein product [Allacma fusca]|uniref:Uncharacterized protein n=1 Tax=Allacma fusca TaxID=39272 RepID=A0A8J2LL11_9HEXA|nr:unnamed protein product [Allacma fusca]